VEGETSGGSTPGPSRAPAGLAGASGAVLVMASGPPRDAVAAVLEEDGWSVHLADEGWALLDLLSHAVASATARAPKLALIEGAVAGPGLPALIARAHSLVPGLPIVVIAGPGSPEERAVSVDPIDAAALRDAIDRVVRPHETGGAAS
jgi:hypothetical protein